MADNLEQKVAQGPTKSLADQFDKNLSTLDGFVGDTLRYGVGSYMATTTLPAVAGAGLAGILGGIIYTTIAGSAAYIATNLAYNLITGAVGGAYSVLRHPIETPGKLLRGLGGFVTSPSNVIKGVFSAPEKIFNYFFKGRNTNKYGKVLGMTVGILGAMKFVTPYLFGKITGAIGKAIPPLKASLGATYHKANLIYEGMKEAAREGYRTFYIHDPVGSAVGGLQQAFASATGSRL